MEKSKGDIDSILNLFNSATKITVSDVIQSLAISRTSAGRRLNDLASQGQIEKIGQGRGCCYIRAIKK
jgi:predicted transcriptional regulator